MIESKVTWNVGSAADIPDDITGCIVAARSYSDPNDIHTGEAFRYNDKWYWMECADSVIARKLERPLSIVAWIPFIPFPEKEFKAWQTRIQTPTA